MYCLIDVDNKLNKDGYTKTIGVAVRHQTL